MLGVGLGIFCGLTGLLYVEGVEGNMLGVGLGIC